MQGITKRQFIKYAVMPGLRPRLQELFFSGFSYISFFIALVYQTVRLLPAGHPYTNPVNVGKFGIRHVIAEAANHLVIDRKNLDQVLLFFMVLVGLVIGFIQISLVFISIAFQPVFAAATMPTNFAGFFLTPNPDQDIALMMLDLVFGVPELFYSCVDPASGANCVDADGDDIVNTGGAWILSSLGWPFPIHEALHNMFRVYSLGLLVIATLITCYFIATVLLETAETGTPFGKRFNKVWAPLRIVVAFGLLVPLGYGLNSSQYVVLYAAKFGSGFATNGWKIFNDSISDTYLGNQQNLVSEPNIPEVGGLLQFMYVASICRQLEMEKNYQTINAYVVKNPLAAAPNMEFANWQNQNVASYDAVMNFVDGDNQVVVRFGYEQPKELHKGNINPVCGEIIIPLADPRKPGEAEPGTEAMQRYYIFIIQELWARVYVGKPPTNPAYKISTYTEDYAAHTACYYSTYCQDVTTLESQLPKDGFRSALQDFYQTDLRAALTDPASTDIDTVIGSPGAVDKQIQSGSWQMGPILEAKGWAGAGIWYNKVAELNGALTNATLNIPIASRYPQVMEYVKEKKIQQDQNVPVDQRFNPSFANDKKMPELRPEDALMARALWEGFKYWQDGGKATTTHTAETGNIFYDAVNAIFGTEGLYSMRRNPTVHPLAQLAGVGRSLVESAVRNIGFAAAMGAGGVVFSTFDKFLGSTAKIAASFLLTVCMITLTAGFVLYYIVPFLPFIYFFFALGGWVKAIFEAMVGAPLWALAHIRIDGDGLPGRAAVAGYFLIFEIFLRPILIVFGLLASISVFAALVAVLNQIWDLVVANTGGFDVNAEVTKTGPSLAGFFRSALDEFFFTVIYAIIVYLMGMSSFKLVDIIPSNILRWIGQSVATTNDSRENAAESLVSTSSVGAQQTISSIGGGLKGALGS